MKALVICPDRPAPLAMLGRRTPMALMRLLGGSLLAHALDALAEAGAKEVTVLASDRPGQIRTAIGKGERWGLKATVLAEPRELTPEEARAKYRGSSDEGWLPVGQDVLVADRLPGGEGGSAIASGRAWLAHAMERLPEAHRHRVGMRDLGGGVWVGMNARIEPGARITGPCWIGEGTWIRSRAVVGPNAFIEARSIVDHDAEVTESWVGSRTYVGAMARVHRSLARGRMLLDCETGSCLEVPDAFLLADLAGGATRMKTSWLGRMAALAALVLTSPVVLVAWLCDRRPWCPQRKAVLPARSGTGATGREVTYREFSGLHGLWRRWPQLWNIIRGEFAWVGNRPLTLEQARDLTSEFDQLWLAAPVGLLSLADAEGCEVEFDDEARAHATYYAAHASARLDRSILRRALGFARRAPTASELELPLHP